MKAIIVAAGRTLRLHLESNEAFKYSLKTVKESYSLDRKSKEYIKRYHPLLEEKQNFVFSVQKKV